jgi:hypothetical protein
MIIGTLTTGAAVATTIDLNYLPANIMYVAATQLTSLTVNVAGDGIVLDVDATGLSSLASIRRYGYVANQYVIPLADGFIPNKVTTLTFTNSAAQTPIIYASNFRNGTAYFVTRRQKVLANSTVNFQNFAYLSINSPVTADDINVTFKNGLVQKFNFAEIPTWLGRYTNKVDVYSIDNLNNMIDNVQYIPSTDRTFYVSMYSTIGNIK